MSKEFLKEASRLNEVKEIAGSVRKIIEEEISRRGSWLGAFDSVVFRVENRLYDPRAEGELGSDEYTEILDDINALRERVNQFKTQYPEGDLPEKLRDELVEFLQEAVK